MLIIFASLLLVACSNGNNGKLPKVDDPWTLCKDSRALYWQLFTIGGTNPLPEQAYMPPQKIPTNYWPLSIQSLKPIEVDRDNFGIYIWIKANGQSSLSDNWTEKGYFVSCTNNPLNIKCNTPFFTESGVPGIYEVTMPALAQ
jgi:hypothetical protein